jgi:outer membrane protein
VGIILFHIFSEHHDNENHETTSGSVIVQAADSAGIRIAFINIDTLESRYDLFSQKKKELTDKQKQAEALFEKKSKAFQDDYATAQKEAASMTEAQMKLTEEKLQAKQEELQQLQDALQSDFQNQLDQFNKQLKDSLDSFLKDYNADKRYTYVLSMIDGGQILYASPQVDITQDAIIGLNDRLKKK